MEQRQLREQILDLVEEYERRFLHPAEPFAPGDRVSYGGRTFDAAELRHLVDAALDFWLTGGRHTERFEREFAESLGRAHCLFVNSGSSANLLAVASLASPQLGERRIRPGDEIVTVAAAFPTTVTPIFQIGAIPVFVDVRIPSYNVDPDRLEDALSEKTRAVVLAHTMGNPFNLAAVKRFCDKHRLWLVEDNCDALGSRYRLDGRWVPTGTVGDFGTSSFYPPHHITTGEGGAVYADDPLLGRIALSMRDWGRDCWCAPGRDDSCGRRFTRRFGKLPEGYDHKYVYSHFGYNLKATEMQAAIGCAQLKKLPAFVEARKRRWNFFRENLQDLDELFILPEPEPDADPSWFGFLLTVREQAPFERLDVVRFLESRNIQTRTLFAGNLLRHPCFDEMRRTGRGFRVVGDLSNTDRIMNRTFWFGVYPGMSDAQAAYLVDSLRDFCREN